MKQIINVTDIISYIFCPRKIYLKLVKKIKEPPTKPMILGFLKHKVFDIFNKNESLLVSSINENINKEEIKKIYSNNVKSITRETAEYYKYMIKKFSISEEDFLNQVLDFVEKEITLRADTIKSGLEKGYRGRELWRNLKPKYLTEFQIISEELGLKGRVDRIKLENTITPYEIKTRKGIYEEDKLQLAAYSLLLENEFNKKVEKGVVETADKTEEVEITEGMKKQILEIADKMRNMIENPEAEKEPEFQNNFSKCRNCRIRKDCFGVGD